MKYIKYFFILLAVIGIGYFIFGELFLPADTPDYGYVCEEFNDGWQVVKEDGTREEIQIPGHYIGKITLERQLPENPDSLAITAQQFITWYIALRRMLEKPFVPSWKITPTFYILSILGTEWEYGNICFHFTARKW